MRRSITAKRSATPFLSSKLDRRNVRTPYWCMRLQYFCSESRETTNELRTVFLFLTLYVLSRLRIFYHLIPTPFRPSSPLPVPPVLFVSLFLLRPFLVGMQTRRVHAAFGAFTIENMYIIAIVLGQRRTRYRVSFASEVQTTFFNGTLGTK